MFNSTIAIFIEKPKKHSFSYGEKIIDVLKRKRKISKLRFLITLQDIDYKKCIYSKYDIIMYNKYNFPGILCVENFDETYNFPYNIQEPVLPRTLYIMLPKECIYIQSHNFTERLIRSKLRELIDIFIVLHAKKLTFFYSDARRQNESIAIDIGTSHPSIASTINNRIDNTEENKFGFYYEMCFEKPTNKIDLNEFLKPYYYYLSQEPEWLQIIKRRIDYATQYDKYIYRTTNTKILKGKFINKLHFLNLSATYDWENFKDFYINYEIEYYPLNFVDNPIDIT